MANGLTGWSRDTISVIRDRIAGDFNTYISGVDARIRHSLFNVFASVFAGLRWEVDNYLDWIANQSHPLYATESNLDAWGRVWDTGRTQAAKASGTCTMTGTNGSVIPTGTVLQLLDLTQFVVTQDATIAAGVATASIVALDYGISGNQAAGVIISLYQPITGVNATGVLVSTGGGGDIETDADYRIRILDRIRNPPHGGNEQDYVLWALDASPDVTNAWVYPNENGIGTVVVRIMMYDKYLGGIPLSADLTMVSDYIEPLRPVTASVSVVAPVAVALNITIDNLASDTTAIRDAITAEIKDMLRRKAEPGGKIYLSWISEAISIVAGEKRHTLTAPVTDITYSAGQIPVLGTITYV